MLIKLGYDCSNSMGFINICLKRSSHFLWVHCTCIFYLIKGLVNHSLMIVTYICVDTDHNVSTTYCCSSSGNSDNLLSMTICTTMVVSDWCVMNLAHGHYHLMKTSSTRLKRSDQLVTIVRKVKKETFIHIICNQQLSFMAYFYLIDEKILRLEIPMKNIAAMTEGQASQ